MKTKNYNKFLTLILLLNTLVFTIIHLNINDTTNSINLLKTITKMNIISIIEILLILLIGNIFNVFPFISKYIKQFDNWLTNPCNKIWKQLLVIFIVLDVSTIINIIICII